MEKEIGNKLKPNTQIKQCLENFKWYKARRTKKTEDRDRSR